MRIRDRLKKKPGDYPQMIFRVNQDDKERLYRSIDRLVEVINKDGSKKGLRPVRKNDVIVDALTIGLQNLERRYDKTKR